MFAAADEIANTAPKRNTSSIKILTDPVVSDINLLRANFARTTAVSVKVDLAKIKLP